MVDSERDRDDPPTTVVGSKRQFDRPTTPPTVEDRPAVDADVEMPLAAQPMSAFDRPDDRFERLGELGRGGMGRVDDAFDRTLGRPVAIKHMLSQTDVALARFEREARITARLEHPGIVPIHEAGRGVDGTPYYVMRRVDGRPLAELVAGKSLAERLQLLPNVLAACDAAGFAHARAIVHRDIKPTNILVGPFGETLLIDWGLARELTEPARDDGALPASEQGLTRAGTVAGTPGFMAPEQARGERVDARADVFALGATLFFVLAGQMPWQTAGATEMVDLAGAGRTADWSLVPKEVPADLRAVLEKAMAGDRDRRYADAGALAADLRRFTLGNLVRAYQYGPIAKLVRFARRHRAAVAVAAISALVLAVVAVISVRRIVAERDDARAARTLAEARQREATAMADGLLVQHARELASSDPAGAVALLRRLSPESTRWREAWGAATAAWLRGIPFGFVADPGAVMLQIAGDNRRVFTITHNAGTLAIVDLVARTRRVVTTLGRTGPAAWLGNEHVACDVLGRGLAIVEVATGKTRLVPLAIRTILGDRSSRVWILTADGRVLELAHPDGELREIANGVDELFASPDLAQVAFVRGLHREVSIAGKTWRLPDRPTTKFTGGLVIRDHVIAAIDDDQIQAWQLVGERVVELGRWPRGNAVLLAIVDGQIYSVSYDQIELLNEHGAHLHRRGDFGVAYSTPGGMIVTGADGSLLLRDREAWFELGKRPAAFNRADVSTDGRFVVAQAQSGDLLAWDLRGLRPQIHVVEAAEQPILLHADHLWTHQEGIGMRRHDLTTGASKTILEYAAPVAWYAVALDEQWAATMDQGGKMLRIYDATRDMRRHFAAPNAVAMDKHGLLMAQTDGSVLRWQPGHDIARQVATLPGPASVLAVADRHIVAAIGTHELVRIDLATGALTRTTMTAPIVAIAIEYAGSAWVVAGGKAWQWELGAATPRRIDTPEPVDHVDLANEGVLFHGNKSLIHIAAGRRQVVSLESQIYLPMGDSLVAFSGAQGNIGVIDLETGERIALPIRKSHVSHLIADESRIAHVYTTAKHESSFAIWNLGVPRDAAALRRWLGEVTNAKPIANSDAVAWP